MSRLTFREKAGDVCYQKQLRDRFAAEGVPPVPHLDVKRAIVRAVSRDIAAQVILKYEWLGTMAHTTYAFGIFFGPFCAGVVCFGTSVTAGARAHEPYGVAANELGVLARGACAHWAPPHTNSRLVAWGCRLLAKVSPVKLVIAYSDEDAGEVGTIYQACNWTYIGTTTPVAEWVAPSGRVFNNKLPSDLTRRRGGYATRAAWAARLRANGWTEQVGSAKHRYATVLVDDARLVALIASKKLPYPKRGRSRESAALVPTREGGATPTRPLQSVELTR